MPKPVIVNVALGQSYVPVPATPLVGPTSVCTQGAGNPPVALRFTVAVAPQAVTAGAVYTPAAVIEPVPDDTDQFTATAGVVVNVWLAPPLNVTVAGVTVNAEAGFTVKVAVPVLPVSATLVAVIVTVSGVVTVAGGV